MKYLTLAWLASSIAIAPATAEVPGQAPAKQDPNKIVCKTQAEKGTRFTSKTCKTRAEWDQMAEEHKRAAKELVDRPKVNTCNDGFAC